MMRINRKKVYGWKVGNIEEKEKQVGDGRIVLVVVFSPVLSCRTHHLSISANTILNSTFLFSSLLVLHSTPFRHIRISLVILLSFLPIFTLIFPHSLTQHYFLFNQNTTKYMPWNFNNCERVFDVTNIQATEVECHFRSAKFSVHCFFIYVTTYVSISQNWISINYCNLLLISPY